MTVNRVSQGGSGLKYQLIKLHLQTYTQENNIPDLDTNTGTQIDIDFIGRQLIIGRRGEIGKGKGLHFYWDVPK